jgi:hypothetical protein
MQVIGQMDVRHHHMMLDQIQLAQTCKPRDILCAQQLDEFLNQNLLRAYAGEGYSPEARAWASIPPIRHCGFV